MKQTVADILAWLDANASGYDQVSVIGMSAGTVTGGAVLMSAPERFASAVLFSGALPWDCGLDDSPGRFAGLRLLWSIDPNDGVMPQELVARSEAWLVEQSGADLTMEHPEGVGHAISPEMARSAATFLS